MLGEVVQVARGDQAAERLAPVHATVRINLVREIRHGRKLNAGEPPRTVERAARPP